MFQRSQGGAVEQKQFLHLFNLLLFFSRSKKENISTPTKCCRESFLADISRANFYTSALMRVFLCVVVSETDRNSLYTSNSHLAYGDVNSRANPSRLTCLLVSNRKAKYTFFSQIFLLFFYSLFFFFLCSSLWLF